MEDGAPEWEPNALASARCWQWCGGWNPERALLFAQLRGIGDIELLFSLLAVIRDWDGHDD